jgi:hypothetical protein
MSAPAPSASLPSYTVIASFRRHVHSGADLAEAVNVAIRTQTEDPGGTVLVIDDETGDCTEADPRCPQGDAEAMIAKLRPGLSEARPTTVGRPRLGVTAREVTLLPRHWEWLAAQPGGASAAIRRLVEEARRDRPDTDRAARARDVACRVMGLFGGDLPNYEEAGRSLYAGRYEEAIALVEGWPDGLGAYVGRLIAAARDRDGGFSPSRP